MVRRKLDPNAKLSSEQEASLKALAQLSDEELDYSDIPPMTDEQLARMVRAGTYKPTKTSTTFRLDSDVLAWLKASGRGWQTRVNEILRREMLGGQAS